MDLEKINAVGRIEGFLPTKPLSELTPLGRYTVTKLRKVKTKYGVKVVAELDSDFIVFLPARFTKLFNKDPASLKMIQKAADSKTLKMRYLGGPYNIVEFKYE